MSTQAKEKRRAKDALRRQAKHDEKMAAFDRRVNDPDTRAVAHAICRSVYTANGCACERRQDMPDCSTMSLAALAAIDNIRAGDRLRLKRKHLPQPEQRL